MARHDRSGNSGSRVQLAASLVADIGNLVPRLAQTIDTVGSVVGFRRWARAMGTTSFYRTRESLWEAQILPLLVGEPKLTIAEFGVAYGEATRWWLERVQGLDLAYHGFDLFTGLPDDWRNLPRGAFDAGGKVPEIEDGRITWHVGDVAETVGQVNWASLEGMKFVNFDLDLFTPSNNVWTVIAPFLRPGDVLYFDEAFDADERVLLTSVILRQTKLKFLGASTFGLAVQVI